MGRPLTPPVSTLAGQLRSLGVAPGDVLLVHTSFRAVRPVESGPAGLIEALQEAVGPRGTLVMPSWPEDTPFDPATSPAAADLGVVADTFWRLPGVQRSDHPMAFAARGPAAEAVLRDPLPLPPHRPESPVGRVRDLDGGVLLLGVDHDANTTIHLAEVEAGVPYGIPKTVRVVEEGTERTIRYRENDHCCQRFRLAGEWLAADGLERVGPVGSATARLVRSRDVVDVVARRLRADPLAFLHPAEAGCEECDEARASVEPGGARSGGPGTPPPTGAS